MKAADYFEKVPLDTAWVQAGIFRRGAAKRGRPAGNSGRTAS